MGTSGGQKKRISVEICTGASLGISKDQNMSVQIMENTELYSEGTRERDSSRSRLQ